MALTRIQPAAIADVREPNFRNILINGDMAVSQRGTSFTSNGYTLDRFTMDESTDGAVTVTQDTDVPAGYEFANSIKLDCTTADASIGAAQYCILTTKFEGQNLQYLKYGTSSAQSLTLSFWVKSVKTGTYCISFVKEAGSGTRYECPIEYTISSASTWEKKTIILTPTAGSTSLITAANGAIVNSNASGFRVIFTLAAGSDFHATNNTWVAGSDKMSTSSQVNGLDSTSNNFWLTGVQLEAGSVATDFEVVPYGQNLQRCYRYYQVLAEGDAYNLGNATCHATGAAYSIIQFLTEMRAAPSLDHTTGTNYYHLYNVDSDTFDSLVLTIISTKNGRMNNGSSISVTEGYSGWFANNNAASYVAFDAEL